MKFLSRKAISKLFDSIKLPYKNTMNLPFDKVPYSLEYNVALYSYNADRNSHNTRGRIIFKVALYPLPPFPFHSYTGLEEGI